MNQSLDAPFNSLALVAIITLPAVSSAVADDSDIYIDPNSLDLDAIPPEELDALIQKASDNSNRFLSTNVAASNPLASSNPSTLESLPCTTPKPSSKPNPLGSHCCSSTNLRLQSKILTARWDSDLVPQTPQPGLRTSQLPTVWRISNKRYVYLQFSLNHCSQV